MSSGVVEDFVMSEMFSTGVAPAAVTKSFHYLLGFLLKLCPAKFLYLIHLVPA